MLIYRDWVSTQQCEHLSSGSGHMYQPKGLDMGPEGQTEPEVPSYGCSMFLLPRRNLQHRGIFRESYNKSVLKI